MTSHGQAVEPVCAQQLREKLLALPYQELNSGYPA